VVVSWVAGGLAMMVVVVVVVVGAAAAAGDMERGRRAEKMERKGRAAARAAIGQLVEITAGDRRP
jgi:type II secretory pathway pseudopilin PulG